MSTGNDTTLSRRLARWLTRFKWYCPPHASSDNSKKFDDNEDETGALMNDGTPCLDAGWEYFERVTLPRHYSGQEEGSKPRSVRDICKRAEPGESTPTKLYSVWNTPEEDLGDFGIGVGLYFSSLRLLCIITFIAGLILLPNMIFFASDDYNDGTHTTEANYVYETSAICLNTRWEPCPTCTTQQWDYFPHTQRRLAFANRTTNDGDQQQQLAFLLVNDCTINYRTGFLSWTALIFVFISICLMNTLYRKHQEAKFDESQQTSSDYTIQVDASRLSDATSPDEWKTFFQQFGHVVGVTVTLDNEELSRALVKRRKYLYDLEVRLPLEVAHHLDIVANPTPEKLIEATSSAWPLAWYEKLLYESPNALYENIIALDKVIDDISRKIQKAEEKSKGNKGSSSSFSYYNAQSVFVTFDTEAAQRRALKDLIAAPPSPDLRFRGTHRLHVKEPQEPGALRWLYLTDSTMQRIKLIIMTTIICITAIILGFIIIYYVREKYGSSYAALAITCLNSMSPYLCGYLVYYESHASEGHLQTSLYVKVTISLWIQTAIITSYITPFTDTLSNDEEGIIHSLFAIYLFEIGRGPAMQILDLYGHMQRHLFAPWAPCQRRMNLCFQGTYWELAERYTNMTNILFLTFYYSAVFPIGFFLSSLALFIHYWTDKFCLLRNWARVPAIGGHIAHVSGNLFIVSLSFFAVMSAYSFSGFPYDNACQHEGSAVDDAYVGDYIAYDMDGNEVEISVEQNDPNYFYCSQDMIKYKPIAFPPIASEQPYGKEWMSNDEARVANLLGYTALGIMILVFLILIRNFLIQPLIMHISRSYKARGKLGIRKFTEVKEICAYVPQVKLADYPFPLILCDLRHIDTNYIGWTSPTNPHEFYNVVNDIPSLKNRPVFAAAKQWIPNSSSTTYGSLSSSSPLTNEQHEVI